MADAEKVIKGLRSCITGLCDVCPYYGKKPCEDTMKREALAMLKAQEPRVVTLEEIEAIPEMVWFERRNAGLYAGIPFRLVNADNEMRAVEIHILDGFVAQMTKWYGKNWRCWTSRPTDEQMEATPWQS